MLHLDAIYSKSNMIMKAIWGLKLEFKIKNFLILILLSFLMTPVWSQDAESEFIQSIYNQSLTRGSSYEWLHYLTKRVGARLSGSPQAAAAVEYTRQMLDSLGLDRVWLQPVEVPHWVRGDKEQVRIVNSSRLGTQDLHATSLGNSIGTGPLGLVGEVIEVHSLKEVEDLGRDKIAGKIVFYNRPMDKTLHRTFMAYGGAVDQRGGGASQAARFGAKAVLVRSMTTATDLVPHTGALRYQDGVPQIPALAIATKDADLLSQLLKQESVSVYLRNTCRMQKPEPSFNVIGEITGSTYPDQVILVGGHLDSWDVGEGAHDDGAGCVQSMQVLQTLNRLGYRPQHTIRCVLFMNEENGGAGGDEYAKVAMAENVFHLAAIESDAGGFLPLGFGLSSDTEVMDGYWAQVEPFNKYLEPLGLKMAKGGGGSDIGPLRPQKGMLFGLSPDSQRYFDYHHTDIDTFDKVNERELTLGAAAMTTLVYLLDQFASR